MQLTLLPGSSWARRAEALSPDVCEATANVNAAGPRRQKDPRAGCVGPESPMGEALGPGRRPPGGARSHAATWLLPQSRDHRPAGSRYSVCSLTLWKRSSSFTPTASKALKGPSSSGRSSGGVGDTRDRPGPRAGDTCTRGEAGQAGAAGARGWEGISRLLTHC